MIVGTIEPVAGNAALGKRRNEGIPAADCACCARAAVGVEGCDDDEEPALIAGFEGVVASLGASGVSATVGDYPQCQPERAAQSKA